MVFDSSAKKPRMEVRGRQIPTSPENSWFAVKHLHRFAKWLRDGGPDIGPAAIHARMDLVCTPKQLQRNKELDLWIHPRYLVVGPTHILADWPGGLAACLVEDLFPEPPDFDDSPDEALTKALRPFGCVRLPGPPRELLRCSVGIFMYIDAEEAECIVNGPVRRKGLRKAEDWRRVARTY